MHQAIVTKYLGPANVRGARVKASAEAGSVVLSWDHALNSDRNHIAAAEALARKLGWSGVYFGGGLPDGGYAFVSADYATSVHQFSLSPESILGDMDR